MMRHSFALCLAIACGVVLTNGAAAQQRFPLSAEASFGFGLGSGGTYVGGGAASVDATLGYRLRATSAGTVIGAINVGLHAPMIVDVCQLLSDGECAPEFPGFYSAGAMLGVQRGSHRSASARVMAGPTYYRSFEQGGALGLQGRFDVATPPFLHTAVVASLRGTVLPSFGGEALGITSFGLGLRIQ